MERNNRLLAWLLLGMAVYFFMSSMRQQQSLREASDKQKQEQRQSLRDNRAREARELAEKIAAEKPELVVPPEAPRQRFTLGSMDPKDGYRFLVTLDNAGAVIERIELVQQSRPGEFDYRSLQTKHIVGYLGYLALEERPGGGLVVHSVPPGSAAQTAVCLEDPSLVGLQVGDIIESWDGLQGPATLYQLDKPQMDKPQRHRKPGDRMKLVVQRPIPSVEAPPAAEISEASDLASSTDSNPAPEKAPAPFKNLTFEATLTQQPVSVLRAEDDFAIEQVKGNAPIGSCALTLAKIDGKELDEGERTILGLEKTVAGNWQARPLQVEGGTGIEFSLPLGSHLQLAGIDANLELVKQYRLLKSGPTEGASSPDAWRYHLDLTTIVRNLDDRPHDVALRQEGLNGVSLEGWWYPTKLSPHFFSSPGARDIVIGDQSSSHSIFMTRSVVDHAKKFPTDPDQLLFGPQDSEARRNVSYLGLDTQVFLAAMQPSPESPDSMKGLQKAKATILNSAIQKPEEFESYRQQAYNTGFWFVTPTQSIPAKSEATRTYRLFAGPKDPELLTAYQLQDNIEYGWQIFGFFAVRLGWILHLFYHLVQNYGLAIVMLTILVRSLMFPVSRRMAVNSQKMQAVQPELAKLRESLKDDPAKMMAAQQLLMKKAGINQLAGCLPAMIQLPIVIGLYRCVSVDVALRQQPLIPGWEWCSNLAGPDMFLDWHSWMPDFIAGRGTGWFGPYLNILPLVTITLFIIQQKVLMPKATDEQTRMAQQMMMIMTIMMGVLFFRVPAGLCIYFITSSTWSLVERFLIKRFTPKADIKTLPENVVQEILTAVTKAGPGQRPTLPSPADSDKPKMKAAKPPETFAELFEPFFKKKPANEPAAAAKDKQSNRAERSKALRNQRPGNSKQNKPKDKP